MRNTFTYSILQYKHSLLLREAVNVGILFLFPQKESLRFVSGNSYRVKAIYPDFDQSVYNSIIKSIENRLREVSTSLFKTETLSREFGSFIHSTLLPEDSTVLQFTNPVSAVDTFDNINKTIKTFSELLLPGIVTYKPEIIRHNEVFLLKKYHSYIFDTQKYHQNKPVIDTRLSRNYPIQHRGVKLKFDVAWRNGSLNLVRPVSFDLKEQQDIQSKSAQYLGYLTVLKDYAKERNYRFDLLVAKPQDNELQDSYREAIEILKDAQAPKRIITEQELESYSEETIDNLLSQRTDL